MSNRTNLHHVHCLYLYFDVESVYSMQFVRDGRASDTWKSACWHFHKLSVYPSSEGEIGEGFLMTNTGIVNTPRFSTATIQHTQPQNGQARTWYRKYITCMAL